MSGKTVLVLLAVNFLLVQSKPAATEEQDLDRLINQIQPKPTTTEEKGVPSVITSSGLNVENVLNQLIQSQSAPNNNQNQDALRGLISNRSFLEWLNTFLQNNQGYNYLSQLFGSQKPVINVPESPSPSNEAQGSDIAQGSNALVTDPAVDVQPETPAVDSRLGGTTRGFHQIIITDSDDDLAGPINAGSQTSNQHVVVSTNSGPLDEQSIHSSEELLNQLQGNFQQQTQIIKDNGFSNGNNQILAPVQPGSGFHQVTIPTSNQLYGQQQDEAEFKRQAQNARYQFATQVNDNINGNFQERAEIREGTKVYGKYAYDDGFVWRTVYYQADENGYKVTKEEVKPTHMTANADGYADVQTLNDGNSVTYHITRQDIGTKHQTHQQEYGFANQQQQYGIAGKQQ